MILAVAAAARPTVLQAEGVAGREHCRSFPARPLADGFLAGLHNAVRDRRPFNPDTGLPAASDAGGRGDCQLV